MLKKQKGDSSSREGKANAANECSRKRYFLALALSLSSVFS